MTDAIVLARRQSQYAQMLQLENEAREKLLEAQHIKKQLQNTQTFFKRKVTAKDDTNKSKHYTQKEDFNKKF